MARDKLHADIMISQKSSPLGVIPPRKKNSSQSVVLMLPPPPPTILMQTDVFK